MLRFCIQALAEFKFGPSGAAVVPLSAHSRCSDLTHEELPSHPLYHLGPDHQPLPDPF